MPRHPSGQARVLTTVVAMDIKTDPIFMNRIDNLSDTTALRYIRSLQAVFVISFAFLVLETVWVHVGFHDSNPRLNLLVMNLVIGGISLVVIAVYGSIAFKNIRVNSTKGVIPKRVQRVFVLALVDVGCFLTMLILFIALDIYLIARVCAWIYSSVEILSFVKWSMFNAIVSNQFLHVLSLLPKKTLESMLQWIRCLGFLRQRTVHVTDGIDLPNKIYAIVFFGFFTATEVCILFSVLASVGVIGGTWCSPANERQCLLELNSTSCNPWAEGCSITSGYGKQTLSIAAAAITVFNMTLYMVSVYWANRQLMPLPYKEYKSIHVQLGYQILTRLSITCLAILNFILIWLIQHSSCQVGFITSVGFAPLILALTAILSISLWMQTPEIVNPRAAHCTGRNILWQSVYDDEDDNSISNTCSFEDIMKGFIFSYMVYDIDELPEDEAAFVVDEFLQEYQMSHHVVIWNKKIDSKCLLAWNVELGKIVMAFRGTASGRNVWTDLKLWREPHPPFRGSYWLGTQPMVHAGFNEFFYGSEMNAQCFDILEQVLAVTSGAKHWELFVCGHSLGGAAAKLAAYETSSWLEERRPSISFNVKCYCFGCPRVGNSAFAKAYNEQCPNTWNIMHLDDVVTRGGKLLYMYKREGRSLFLTEIGSIVEPSYIEKITLRGIKTSIPRHLMPSYGCSIVTMVKQEDWNSPMLQRIYFAITSAKPYRSISKKFSNRPEVTFSALSDLNHDIDLATGISTDLIHRSHMSRPDHNISKRSILSSLQSFLHGLFSS